MGGKFIVASEVKLDTLDWGQISWISNPLATGAKQLTVADGRFFPGKGHSFHLHPSQEEVLFIVTGKVEQWIEREWRILLPGDSAFIPAGMVHASFNVGEGEAKVIAIFSPCVGDIGFETVEMGSEVPWNSLRYSTDK